MCWQWSHLASWEGDFLLRNPQAQLWASQDCGLSLAPAVWVPVRQGIPGRAGAEAAPGLGLSPPCCANAAIVPWRVPSPGCGTGQSCPHAVTAQGMLCSHSAMPGAALLQLPAPARQHRPCPRQFLLPTMRGWRWEPGWVGLPSLSAGFVIQVSLGAAWPAGGIPAHPWGDI